MADITSTLLERLGIDEVTSESYHGLLLWIKIRQPLNSVRFRDGVQEAVQSNSGWGMRRKSLDNLKYNCVRGTVEELINQLIYIPLLTHSRHDCLRLSVQSLGQGVEPGRRGQSVNLGFGQLR